MTPEDFKRILAAEENYPYIKVRIPGESFWARDLGMVRGQHLVMVRNNLLDPTYRLSDIVRIDRERNVRKLVYRFYTQMLGFRWDPDPVNEDDLKLRNAICDANKAHGDEVSTSFLFPGLGFILLSEKMSVPEVWRAVVDACPALREVVLILPPAKDPEEGNIEILWQHADFKPDEATPSEL